MSEPVLITKAADPRVVLYRTKPRRDHRAHQRLARELAGRALEAAGATAIDLGGKLRRLDCVVAVHYGERCLRQLLSARALGRRVHADSAFLPASADAALLDLARRAVPPGRLFIAEHTLLEAEFVGEGWRDAGLNYTVGFPVQQPLATLKPPLLVLDNLGAAQNVGQLLRTAFHLGIRSVLASRGSWSNLSGRACRVSQGWMYHLDFHVTDSLPAAVREIRARGVHVLTAEEYFPKPVTARAAGDRHWALVVGHEDRGVSPGVIAESDSCVRIPQQRGESLNVAHAAAICLYELMRHQRP